ncbi:MAG: GNAT family N-acetyltransferase, partial [Opitutaceae bacterium]|nr:GNAT family N-acetyltransferase [Verrucomicrobiales bacterium]
MNVEQASLTEAPLVMHTISLCLTDLRSREIHQWDETYPNLECVENDARAGSLFVIRHENACVASVCLNETQPEQYRSLPWRCADARALVIHRLCVHPQWQGRGLAGKLMDFTEDFARRFSFASIRLDAYIGNPP